MKIRTKYIYLFKKKNLQNFYNLANPLGATTTVRIRAQLIY